MAERGRGSAVLCGHCGGQGHGAAGGWAGGRAGGQAPGRFVAAGSLPTGRRGALAALAQAGGALPQTPKARARNQPPLLPPCPGQIYVFYRLGSYFQNYRRYVRSYDSTQMHDGGSGAGAAACEPFQYVNFNANASLQNGGAILPCGQIAYSNFNDSYTMQLVAAGGGSAAIALDVSCGAGRCRAGGRVGGEEQREEGSCSTSCAARVKLHASRARSHSTSA